MGQDEFGPQVQRKKAEEEKEGPPKQPNLSDISEREEGESAVDISSHPLTQQKR